MNRPGATKLHSVSPGGLHEASPIPADHARRQPGCARDLARASDCTAALLAGTTLEGQPYDLKAEQGKVVLVFFWSTDCAVCRDKMPELRLNYEAWRSKGFQLVAVNLDKSLAAVQDYQGIVDRMVPKAQRFPSLWRGAAAHRDSFGPVAQTPTTFVLDRKHKVVKRGPRPHRARLVGRCRRTRACLNPP